jgi:hypothetical protein
MNTSTTVRNLEGRSALERVAMTLICNAVEHDGGYPQVIDYLQTVVDGGTKPCPMALIQYCENRADDTENPISYALCSLALLYLADAIVAQRLHGEGERTIQLGFGVAVTTSLSAAIVEYHNRVRHALTCREMLNWYAKEP